MVFDEPSMLYSTVNNDDDEVDGLDGDDAVSSQSKSDDDNNPEEGEFQTPLKPVNPVNLVTENIVPQWESSQWFSSARYDYTHSGVFLDMGSDGFSYCRPVISVDKTHLRRPYKGVLLIASTWDANNHLFLLAFAIVDKESSESGIGSLKTCENILSKIVTYA
ncbi:hypothetical protein M9H77_25295 [Catharanthus roseus]|uniref:Uncharacterized protein n=1 Tax=Catharanthus roseus TaxID=4058 RepID=A0ACC0A6G7_CATRO|nr:hypothetical protein M9H77_25295 [Catharanthus roseus]